jgi:hypothetical protein
VIGFGSIDDEVLLLPADLDFTRSQILEGAALAASLCKHEGMDPVVLAPSRPRKNACVMDNHPCGLLRARARARARSMRFSGTGAGTEQPVCRSELRIMRFSAA